MVSSVPFNDTPIKNTASLFVAGNFAADSNEVVTEVKIPIWLIQASGPAAVSNLSPIQYSLDVFNNGLVQATGTSLVVRIPFGTEYEVGSLSAGAQVSYDGGVNWVANDTCVSNPPLAGCGTFAPTTRNANITHVRFFDPGAPPGGWDAFPAGAHFQGLASTPAAPFTIPSFRVIADSGLPAFPADGVIRLAGTLTSDQTTPKVSNIVETVISDLQLTLAADKTFAVPTDPVEFTLTARDSAAGNNYEDVAVIFPLPSFTDLQSPTAYSAPAGWIVEYSIDGGANYVDIVGTPPDGSNRVTHVRFRRPAVNGPLAGGGIGDEVFTVQVTVDAAVPAMTILSTSGTVTGTETAGGLATTTVPSNIVQLPLVFVRHFKSVTPLAGTAGDILTWTMVTENLGATTANNVVLTDPGSPAGNVFTFSELVAPPANSPTCVPVSCDITTSQISWNLGDMIPGAPPIVRTFQTRILPDPPAITGTQIRNLTRTVFDEGDTFSNLVSVVVGSGAVIAGSNAGFFVPEATQTSVCYPASITNTGGIAEGYFIGVDEVLTGDPNPWVGITLYHDRDADGILDQPVGPPTAPLTVDPGALDQPLTTVAPVGIEESRWDSEPAFTLAPGGNARLMVCLETSVNPVALATLTASLNVIGKTSGQSATFADVTTVLGASAVRLRDFRAVGAPGGILVSWTSIAETNNRAFVIHRGPSSTGPWELVTDPELAGAGTYLGNLTYAHLDTAAPPAGSLWYLLTDVEFSGQRRIHAPVAVDRDGDGIPFPVEAALGLSDADSSDAAADPDGDGVATGTELSVGRDPFVSDAPDAVPAAGEVVEATPPPQGIRIVESGENYQVLELQLWGFGITNRSIDGAVYQYPYFEGVLGGTTEQPGLPALPVLGTFLPPGFTSVTVLDTEEVDRVGVLVGPAPDAREDAEQSNLLPVYAPDSGFYSGSPARYPEALYRLDDRGGQPRLLLHPFAYDHEARRLVFRSRIRVRVERNSSPGLAVAGLTIESSDLGVDAMPNGPTFTMRTSLPGVYRLSGADLVGLGADPAGVDPRNVSLWHGGVEVPVRIQGEGDGIFDPADVLEFYSPETDDRYAAGEGFHLLYGAIPGARWLPDTTHSGPPVAPFRTSYRHIETVRHREFYFATIPGAHTEDRFLSPPASWASAPATPRSALSISVSDPSPSGNGIARVTYATIVERDGLRDHHHVLDFDGTAIGEGFSDGRGFHQAAGFVGQTLLSAGSRIVGLTASLDGLDEAGVTNDLLLPRDVSLEYDRQFVAAGDSLGFLAATTDAGVQISGFTGSDVTLLDITNPFGPREITNVSVAGAGPFSLTLGQDPTKDRQLHAFAPAGTRGIADVTLRPAVRAGLRATTNRAGWVAIAPAGWEGSLAPLAALRNSEGLEPLVVTMDAVADAFGGGVTHPEAIRRFMAFARQNWDRAPEYLLLGSDTHVNPRNYASFLALWDPVDPLGVPAPIFYIGRPRYAAESPRDTWYALLDGEDDVPELAVGRLPASTAGELAALANKIVAYDSASGTWARQVLSIADDVEPQFSEIAEATLEPVLPGLAIQRYYQGDTTTFPNLATYLAQLQASLQDGALFAHFVGHGDFTNWTAANIIDKAFAAALSNGSQLPFIASMTCYDGYFLNPVANGDSLGEALVSNPSGGAIAFYGSGIQSTIPAKELLHRSIFQAMFVEDRRLVGDVIRRALALFLANSDDPDQLARSFNLLGDPATKLRIPNPRMPVAVTAEVLADGTYFVTWNPVTAGSGEVYHVFRRVGGAPAQLLAVVTTPTYLDADPALSGITPGTSVFYSVRAYSPDGLGSPPSVEAGIQIAAAVAGGFVPSGSSGGGGGCDASHGSSGPMGAFPYGLLFLFTTLRSLSRRRWL